MRGWGPALRIARRTLRRSRGRTVLVATLIGVPVAAAVVLAVILRTTNPEGERLADIAMGTADATVHITPYPSVTVEPRSMRGTEVGWVSDGVPPTGPLPKEVPSHRPLSDVDVRSLLPAGTDITPNARAHTPLTIDGVRSAYFLRSIDSTSSLQDGQYRTESGRLPAGPDEVAVSVPVAERQGWSEDDFGRDAAVETPEGQRYTVVGVVSSVTGFDLPMVWAQAESSLFGDAPAEKYLLDLPEDADVAALQRSLAAEGVVLTPREMVVDPPGSSVVEDVPLPQMLALIALFVGFGMLEIVLLAGAAFAVGARRQVRELGLVGAQGGTPRDVRRVILAQGLVTGVVGGVAGVVVGIGAAVVARPVWERVTGMAITSWDIPVLVVIGVAVLGVVAGLGAAVMPARAARRMPVLAALNARFRADALRARVPLAGVGMIAAGVTAVVWGSVRMGAAFAARQAQLADEPAANVAGVTPLGSIALVLAGITLVVVGLVWTLPSLIATVSRVGGALPLSMRLALRDVGRHRHRTGPAAAAIMMAVAAAIAASYAFANQIAEDEQSYVPTTRHGDAVLSVTSPDSRDALPAPVYSADLVDQVSDALPVRDTFETGYLVAPSGATAQDTTPAMHAYLKPSGACEAPECGTMANPIRAVDPAMLQRLAGDAVADEVAALRAGQIVVTSDDALDDGTVTVAMARDQQMRQPEHVVPAVVASGLPRTEFTMTALIGIDTARTLGDVRLDAVTFALDREPTEDELAQVAAITEFEHALRVEQGLTDYSMPAMLIALGVCALVALLGVGISVALSAAEGRADLATLAAIGARPSTRRRLAAAQAWFVAEIGCLLGIGVGSLYGYTSHTAIGSPYLAVPWSTLAGVATVVPLFAAALAWVFTRSRLPMVRRMT